MMIGGPLAWASGPKNGVSLKTREVLRPPARGSSVAALSARSPTATPAETTSCAIKDRASFCSRAVRNGVPPGKEISASVRAIDLRPRRRHAEIAAADVGERRNAFVNFFVTRAGEAEAQAASTVLLVDRPLRPRVDRHASRERRFVELHRVDAVGQLHPQEDTALCIGELDRAAEVLAQRLHQRLELGAEPLSQFGNMLREIARAEFR